jgi:hypothetical protein
MARAPAPVEVTLPERHVHTIRIVARARYAAPVLRIVLGALSIFFFVALNRELYNYIRLRLKAEVFVSGNWTTREIGLETFPSEDRPSVLIPLFGFRIMAGWN